VGAHGVRRREAARFEPCFTTSASYAIKPAWTRRGPFPINGRFTKLRYVNPWPKPLHKPHPPIWCGGRLGRDLEVRCGKRLHVLSLGFFDHRAAMKLLVVVG
jgi:alkanesulfonate monooxygenase SsuD/methylene tetrahydromethanopterin reductase-like flavin-dependent oxidoreductase (luciferase family)